MPLKNPKCRSGFTLLEMSIVLVVVGLILGGVMLGSALIKSSELQSIVADIDRYKKATITFRDKYKELPGDFSSATTIWGADTNCVVDTSNFVPKVPTCNGNGDGFIAVSPIINGFYGLVDGWETLRAWQQLANAGLIEGMYIGTSTPTALAAGTFYQPEWNTPTSKLNKGKNGYLIRYFGPDDGSGTDTFAAEYGHVIRYDRLYRSSIFEPADYALLPAEAFSIDEKIDDGIANTGEVLAQKNVGATNCATAAMNPVYNTLVTSRQCNLIFITGF